MIDVDLYPKGTWAGPLIFIGAAQACLHLYAFVLLKGKTSKDLYYV